MFSRSTRKGDLNRSLLVGIFLAVAIFLGITSPVTAAGVKVVPSSIRVSPGDFFSVDIVAENIPSAGLSTVQFKLQVDAQGSPVSGVADTSLGSPADVSIATPLIIGPSTAGRSGLGDFFRAAMGPHGILVMDNENLTNGSALFTYGQTYGSTPPSGSGSVARFQFAVGTDVAATKITISLSDVLLLDAGVEYTLDSNVGAIVDIGCATVVPELAGLSFLEAQTTLQLAGLTVGSSYEIDNPGSSLPLNEVLQQFPSAGAAAQCDSSVNLAINTAPAEVTTVCASDKDGDQTGTVVLSWVPSVSPDTAGYRIYSLPALQSPMAEIASAAAAGAEIAGLTNAQATELRIVAFDTFGNESLGVIVSATPVDDVAPSVAALPAGGAFQSATSVTLGASELADIYYTLDGSPPGINSLPYSAPILVTTSAVLKCIAIDVAGNVSPITTETYTVNSSTITVHVETSQARQLAGLKVYLFKENGAYTNLTATTDAMGNADFNLGSLASGNHKFRIDYLGYQFWSGIIPLPGAAQTTVLIAEEAMDVAINPASSGVRIYLFTQAGSYMSQYQTTNSLGKASFYLPVGKEYKFRADYLSSQYWSPVVTAITGGANFVTIDLGGGALILTVQKQTGSPMVGVATYLYNNAGTYMNQTKTTDASGVVQFNVSLGSYKVRADYLGYQFWTSEVMVTADSSACLDIPHQTAAVTVNDVFQGVHSPHASIPNYLFTAAGTYLNITGSTDSAGVVTFELPQRDYKVRADFLGRQYWSQIINWQDVPINIPMSDAQIGVTGNGAPLSGVAVYVFSAAGSYLNISDTTDASGLITFRLPSGDYKFRADYQAKQFWSATETSVADALTQISLSTGGGSFELYVSKTEQAPLPGVKSYVFNEGGPYLNMTGVTDADGKTSFGLSDGDYQFRVDLLGYQIWTDVLTVPAALNYSVLLDYQDDTITVQGQYASDIRPISGALLYLFHPSGSYLSMSGATDAGGHVVFSLPQLPFLVRADYLGQQFWSAPFAGQDAVVNIPEGIARINVNMTGQDVAGALVYVYNASGAYLNVFGTTDAAGIIEFRLPAGSYTFRADYQDQQFRVSSGVVEGIVNDIEIGSVGAVFALFVDTGSGPLAGVRIHAFSAGGTYLGLYGDTDESGRVTFDLVDGSFRFRIDHLGYQYWTDAITLPDLTQYTITIMHRHTAVTLQGVQGSESRPLGNLPVYLFTASGSHLGEKKDADLNGQTFFFLPDAEYKLRADYLGSQFWSDIFRFTDPVITVNEGTARVVVQRAGTPISNAKVYLFSENGTYLGRFTTTDLFGVVEFMLPDRNFRFRIDEDGSQYWSQVIGISPGQVNEIAIELP